MAGIQKHPAGGKRLKAVAGDCLGPDGGFLMQEKKYDLKQVLAEIEEDLSVEHKDMAQEVDISQSVIMNLMRENSGRKDPNNNSRDNG